MRLEEDKMFTLMLLKRAGILTSLILLLWVPAISAATSGPSTQATVNTLLSAIATNDYDVFVANAMPSFKTIVTKEAFKQVNIGLSPRLKRGYELQYLGSFKHDGIETFLWKIVYKDGGDDMLAELELQGEKVAFFWFPPPPPPPGFTPGSAGPPGPR